MSPNTRKEPALEEQYRQSLQQHLQVGGEAPLLEAYELGRQALANGTGILDLIALHRSCLENLMHDDAGKDQRNLAAEAVNFLSEVLSPYEIARMGGQESNRALRRLFDLLEKEARRIAYSLHDESAQILASVYLELAAISKSAPDGIAQRVNSVSRHLDDVRDQLRRLSHELRPLILDQLGLIPALRFLAQSVGERTGLHVDVDGELPARLDEPVETVLYRTVQESLTNVYKHASADAVDIEVWLDKGRVNCRVTDDGVGLKPTRSVSRGLGLVSIQERISALGGESSISNAKGKGAQLWVSIPVK